MQTRIVQHARNAAVPTHTPSTTLATNIVLQHRSSDSTNKQQTNRDNSTSRQARNLRHLERRRCTSRGTRRCSTHIRARGARIIRRRRTATSTGTHRHCRNLAAVTAALPTAQTRRRAAPRLAEARLGLARRLPVRDGAVEVAAVVVGVDG